MGRIERIKKDILDITQELKVEGITLEENEINMIEKHLKEKSSVKSLVQELLDAAEGKSVE